jgi:LAO/AO transport system kinase
VDELTSLLRRRGEKVGVIAVDPTSPFTGGALLGDRIRMGKIAEDGSVFMRSMATRGTTGGLARATDDAADILDAGGKSFILVETVGVGQSEVEIARATDCVIVILSPESGDGIQAMKSGLMEIADLLVINKADRPGADRLEGDLRSAFEYGLRRRDETPILRAEAFRGTGIPELLAAVEGWVRARRADGSFLRRRHENVRNRIKRIVEFLIQKTLWEKSQDRLEKLSSQVLEQGRSSYQVADDLMNEVLR